MELFGYKNKNSFVLTLFAGWMLFFGSDTLAQEVVQIPQSENKIQDAFLAARLESAAGHYDKAYFVLDSLAREHRNRAVIYYEMALLYIEQKNYAKAEEKLQRALGLDKDHFWYNERMAFVQTELVRLDKAIEHYRKLISLKPKMNKYYDVTADLLIKSNRKAEAFTVLVDKETQLGFSESNTVKMIDIALDLQKPEKAIPEIEKLLSRKNPKLQHLKKAAEVYKMAGQKDKVEAINQKILVLDPNDVDVLLDNLEKSNGIPDETAYLISLQPLMENRSVPAEAKLKELLPFVEGHASNPKVAYAQAVLQLAEILANTHPSDARVHAMYGDVLMNSHREVEAVRQYQRTLQINKNNFMVWEQLMFSLEYTREFTTLEETAKEAMDYFPNQAIAYYFAAVPAYENKKYKEASDWLDEATLIAGKNPVILTRVLVLQSKIAFATGKEKEALDLVENSISSSKGQSVMAYEWKGDMLSAKGMAPDACTNYKKALSLMPDSKTLVEKIKNCP